MIVIIDTIHRLGFSQAQRFGTWIYIYQQVKWKERFLVI
jgi:hypothetical protein